jgi:hypothetical protein
LTAVPVILLTRETDVELGVAVTMDEAAVLMAVDNVDARPEAELPAPHETLAGIPFTSTVIVPVSETSPADPPVNDAPDAAPLKSVPAEIEKA